VIVEYYSEPALINKVGTCVTVVCPRMPKGRTCTGTQTQWSTVDQDTCDGGP
jgi:hypothetical protein